MNANMICPDDDLERRVLRFLDDRGVPNDKATISVHVDNGIVVLKGRMASLADSERCENCCRRVAGVSKVINQVFIEPSIIELSESHCPYCGHSFHVSAAAAEQSGTRCPECGVPCVHTPREEVWAKKVVTDQQAQDQHWTET